MVVVAMVVATIVVVVVMAIAVIIMVPVSFVEAPSLLVMVIMRMAPISAGVRRPVPTSWNPYVPSVSSLIAHRWRISADIDANL
jgi:hypothetical protein